LPEQHRETDQDQSVDRFQENNSTDGEEQQKSRQAEPLASARTRAVEGVMSPILQRKGLQFLFWEYDRSSLGGGSVGSRGWESSNRNCCLDLLQLRLDDPLSLWSHRSTRDNRFKKL
jgi:hypothetical protein